MDLRRDPATRKGALARVGEQLGINPETLRNWVTQAEVGEGHRPGKTTAEQARINELEREVRELRRANHILKTASVFFAADPRPPVQQVVAYIDDHRHEVVEGRQLGVEPICEVLQVAPSTYYAAKTRRPSRRSITDTATTTLIERIHARYGVYGARKAHAELRRQRHRVARCTVERLMRTAGLRGITRARGPRTHGPWPRA